MRLKTRLLKIEAGGRNIAIVGNETASSLGVHSTDRVEITHKSRHLVAIVNISGNLLPGLIGVYTEVSDKLEITTGEIVDVQPAEKPEALNYVQEKIRGERLRKNEIHIIVKDVVERHLSDVELAAFITALHVHGISMEEIEAMSRAMVGTGTTLNIDSDKILDKHSIGGVPGDKTSILIVPIIAAAGYVIPKTSSRAVTSAAGTADRFENLCPVNLKAEQIREVVEKTNGCIAWGGALDLAPADDIFIQVEYPLAIDPLLLPSIMSKKKAIGATHLVIDIPTGRGTKMKTTGEADELAYDFVDLGKRLGMNVQCALTYGEQPVGHAIGPALEAREALASMMGNGPPDLVEKATSLAGILLEMAGTRHGKETAEHLLQSGKAERKLRQIIEAQGGNPKIKPEDIGIGEKATVIPADKDGHILWINNEGIARIAREAGAPKERGAGVMLNAKLGDHVKKGQAILEIVAERNTKLEAATKLTDILQPVGLSRRPEDRMLMERIPYEKLHKRTFVLER
jgi:AMP phosphorylase